MINCCQVRRSRVPWILKLYKDGECAGICASRTVVLINLGMLFYVYLLSKCDIAALFHDGL